MANVSVETINGRMLLLTLWLDLNGVRTKHFKKGSMTTPYNMLSLKWAVQMHKLSQKNTVALCSSHAKRLGLLRSLAQHVWW